MSIQYKKSDILSVANVAALFNLKVSDNHLVQTQGYSTEGIGSNLYRYDSTSTATIDGGFVLPGIGGTLSFSGTTFSGTGGTGRFIAVNQTLADADQWGASGDGSTDDVNDVNRMITSAYAAGCRRFIMAPSATYVVSTYVYFNQLSGFDFDLNGSTIQCSDTSTIDANGQAIRTSQCSNFRIHNGTLDGNRDNRGTPDQVPAHNLGMYYCTDFVVERVTTINAVVDGFYCDGFPTTDYSTKCVNGSFIDCVADSNTRQGLSVIAGKNIRVIRGSYTNTGGLPPGAGIDFEADVTTATPGVESCVIEGVLFAGNKGRAVILSSIGESEGSVIKNCRFEGNGSETTFTVTGSSDVISATAHGFEVGTAIVVRSSGTLPTGISKFASYYVVEVTTDTLKISSTYDGSAISPSDVGSGTHYMENAGGDIHAGHSSSIQANYFAGITPIRGCIDVAADSTGDITVTENTFVDVASAYVENTCVYTHGSSAGKVIISSNTVTGSSNLAYVASSNVVVSNNTVVDATKDYASIAVVTGSAKSVSIIDNVCTGGYKNGVYSSSTGKGIVISGNTMGNFTAVAANLTYGAIRTTTGYATIENNTIFLDSAQTSATAIAVYATGCLISGNSITGYSTTIPIDVAATYASRITETNNPIIVVTASASDTTPSVRGASRLATANSGATTVTDFDDGVGGQLLMVTVDANTTVQSDGVNIFLAGDADFTGLGTLTLRLDGTAWYEVARSVY